MRTHSWNDDALPMVDFEAFLRAASPTALRMALDDAAHFQDTGSRVWRARYWRLADRLQLLRERGVT